MAATGRGQNGKPQQGRRYLVDKWAEDDHVEDRDDVAGALVWIDEHVTHLNKLVHGDAANAIKLRTETLARCGAGGTIRTRAQRW